MPVIINNGIIKDISVSGFNPSQGHPSPTQCPFPLPHRNRSIMTITIV